MRKNVGTGGTHRYCLYFQEVEKKKENLAKGTVVLVKKVDNLTLLGMEGGGTFQPLPKTINALGFAK